MVLIPLFFFSGISALLYQVVWLKYLGFVFGNTVHAAATLIAVFLAGLGIGAFLFSRIARKRNPLFVYAVVEALIGAIAAFSPNAFRLLDELYIASYHSFIDAPAALTMARVACAALFLLPPTILMGGTLPLLVRAFALDEASDRRAVAILYAANTFGATAGVALAGFVTVPLIGFVATIFVGVLINFSLALVSVALASAARGAAPAEVTGAREREGATAASPSRAKLLLLASLLMGLTSIADEVFWSRILVLHLGSSVYAYSLMLFSFLIGLATGSSVVDKLLRRFEAARVLGIVEILLAVVMALQIHYFVHFADVLEFFARVYGVGSYTATLLSLLSATLSAILIPTALMGASFPLTAHLHRDASGRSASDSVGSVYFFNTIGSILGSFLAGFIIIRWIGSQNGLLLMAAINLLLGVWILMTSGHRSTALKFAIPAALICLASASMARRDQVLLSAGLFTDHESEVLLFREDVTATVTVRRFAKKYLSLELNGVNVAGTSPDLIGTQKLQGHLPLLIHPAPKSVLHIGFGSGGTAYAVSTHPVKNITVAEISPEVLETSDRYLREVNHHVLADKRVRALINDGRNHVLAAPEKYDVILSDSIHPRYAGNGSLYTKDYFELCRQRLNPNGVVSMWLPIYSLTPRNFLMIMRAFHDVFPNTLVWYVPNVPNSFLIVIGRTEPGPLPLQRIAGKITPTIGKELTEIGIRNNYDLLSALLVDSEGVAALTARSEPHMDDRPAVEYESGRVVHRELTWYQTFKLLSRSATPLERAVSGADPAGLRYAEGQRERRGREHLAYLEKELGLSGHR